MTIQHDYTLTDYTVTDDDRAEVKRLLSVSLKMWGKPRVIPPAGHAQQVAVLRQRIGAENLRQLVCLELDEIDRAKNKGQA